MKKTMFGLLVLSMVCLMMSSAMAFTVVNRSAEMTAKSPNDQAGTIKMTFEKTDYDTINEYLFDALGNRIKPYSEIRIALTATDVAGTEAQPVLAKDIKGKATAEGLPHSGELVLLDQSGIEMSYLGGAGKNADSKVYVWGQKGDQLIHVYITEFSKDLDPKTTGFDWSYGANRPWFAIGLYEELLNVKDISTAICVDVHDLGGFNKLTISNETVPQGLKFSGDNEIGHFLNQPTKVSSCDGKAGAGPIELCEAVADNTVCNSYEQCIEVKGVFPSAGDFNVWVSSQTKGVYIENIIIDAPAALNGWTFYDSASKVTIKTACGDYEAQSAKSSSAKLEDIADEKMKITVTYNVNVKEAVVGSSVKFKVWGSTLPCGDLFNGEVVGASFIKCAGLADSMYFPYVLTGSGDWSNGLVVTNLSSKTVKASDMEVEFTLTDSKGDVFSKTVDNFDTTVFSFDLDTKVDEWGWKPAAGNAWLNVETNFYCDGYHYVTNGAYGVGTLPRLAP